MDGRGGAGRGWGKAWKGLGTTLDGFTGGEAFCGVGHSVSVSKMTNVGNRAAQQKDEGEGADFYFLPRIKSKKTAYRPYTPPVAGVPVRCRDSR